MGIGSLEFRLLPEAHPHRRPAYSIVIDGGEFVTSSFLLDDIEHLLGKFEDIALPQKKFDLLFTGASPFSVSITGLGGSLLLRISDNFDGGVLEEPVDPSLLKTALAEFIEDFLGRPGPDAAVQTRLREALGRFRAWPGPVLRM
jgi:hypothetical protein